MGERVYKRSTGHEELAGKVDFNGQLRFAQAEVICWGLLHIGDALCQVAEALSPTNQPKWAKRLERMMSQEREALDRIESNLSSLSTEVDDISTVLANVAQNVDDPAVTTELNQIADRLATVKDTLENATTLDDPTNPVPDPAPQPDPTPPADPGTGDQPGDQPPADQPPTV
jgi:hypothetical protein